MDNDQRIKVAAKQSFDGLLYDIAEPFWQVEVKTSDSPGGRKTLWVNVGPVCVLRICGIEDGSAISVDVQHDDGPGLVRW